MSLRDSPLPEGSDDESGSFSLTDAKFPKIAPHSDQTRGAEKAAIATTFVCERMHQRERRRTRMPCWHPVPRPGATPASSDHLACRAAAGATRRASTRPEAGHTANREI